MRRFAAGASIILTLLLTIPAIAQSDYGFLWWAHGWRGTALDGARVICVQTNHYGLVLDVSKPTVRNLGAIDAPNPYAVAVADANEVVFNLPPATLGLTIKANGDTYTCVRAATEVKDQKHYPVRLIESGQWVQRFDIEQLVFENEVGEALDVKGRLEVIAWPDKLHFLLELSREAASETPHVDVRVQLGQGKIIVRESGKSGDLEPGQSMQVGLAWEPGGELPRDGRDIRINATDERNGNTIPVAPDPLRGWHNVALPEAVWSWADEPKRLDRFSVSVTNPGTEVEMVPINFAVDGNLSGLIGMTPMLFDSNGRPTGIPVQVSKNWHRQPDERILYEGPWFHGFTQIEVPPGETWTGELVIAYAWWGDVPAVSHAQLSLIGWGTNQRWDQVAIGSWGESITYDPDVNLRRSIIDDVRPLMVKSMQNGGDWQWTVNVGGGDFLVYYDEAGKRQYLSRMRAAYLEPGPNLTRTIYAGRTPDGALEARLEVSSPRCDDVNRAFHKFRYDIRKPMAFSRLAFYQLGADNYNDHQFATIARGNETGVLEEWQTERGGKQYLRTGIPIEGDVPWFSLHDGERNKHHPQGAWANRGLVIRSWKARLGGKDVAHPTAAIFGTDNNVPSAALELVPPPGCTELMPGDYVEAEVELLVIPAEPDTYYGPNEAFKEHLEANINTWNPVHRLATANTLTVATAKGEVRRNYPVEIATNAGGEAECTITGGAGYVPVTFTGLPTATGFRLEGDIPNADNFVQVAYDDGTNTWSRTYNVDMDGAGEAGKVLWLVGE